MAAPAIRFRNVNVSLGGQRILSDVSFDVDAGTVHAIVGPNGGGKTTLVRALLGQVPFEGAIELEGAPVIGYAPQTLDFDLTLPFTALDILAVMNQRKPAFLGRAKAARAAQDEMLARLGLADKARRLFGQLSGGERQRLLFAQALIPAPNILLMDEATSQMDADGSRLVEAMVGDLAARGVTILWINHDWAQVRRVASRATWLDRKLGADGAPRDILPERAA